MLQHKAREPIASNSRNVLFPLTNYLTGLTIELRNVIFKDTREKKSTQWFRICVSLDLLPLL